MKTVDVKVLLEKGAYFGHKVSRTNPKTLKYVYEAQNGIYIIDLFKTKAQIESTMNYLQSAGKANESLLIVASKRIIKNYLTEYCSKNNIPYITEKWVGGFFTNFEEIHKNITRANTWIKEKTTGGWDGMLKHERVKLDKELNKFLKVYKGVLNLEKIPENILIIDVKKEKNALNESQKIKSTQVLGGNKSLTIVGVADTNADPTQIDYPIIVNDDSTESLEYIMNFLLESYLEGLKSAPVVKEPAKEGEVKADAPVAEVKETVEKPKKAARKPKKVEEKK